MLCDSTGFPYCCYSFHLASMDCKGVAPVGFWFRKEGGGTLLAIQLPKMSFTETKKSCWQLFEK